jgi:adenylate kinase
MSRPLALTGTPGTGKSTVARHLRGVRWIEVADLARHWGLARPREGTWEVDLDRLVERARGPHALSHVDVVVGHLAHLLPLRDVVVLRCHPRELGRRLGSRRRGAAGHRRDNVVVEATDLVLLEAIGPGRRVLEIDTTRRTPDSVAREVERSVRRGVRPRYGAVRWLEEPSVTDYLLDVRP